MSYDDPEEELLDQHLREAFSEFELPPARRVWNGIESRIGAQPGATQPLLSLKVLLPALVLAGVAAGWLLPHPTPKPAAKTTTAVPVMATSPAAATEVAASGALLPSAAARGAAASAGRPLSVASSQQNIPTKRPEVIAPLTPQLPVMASVSGLSHTTWLAPEADTTDPAYWSTPHSISAASVTGELPAPASVAAEAPKADGVPAYRAEFRQPTHRRAEKGRSIRRHLSAVGQWARHLVSPRRARTAGQPNF